MKIEDICISDCKVIQTLFHLEMIIKSPFLINEERRMKNVKIRVSDWTKFNISIFEISQISGKSIERVLNHFDFFEFEMIQQVTYNNESLQFKGCNEDGIWMEYHFQTATSLLRNYPNKVIFALKIKPVLSVHNNEITVHGFAT